MEKVNFFLWQVPARLPLRGRRRGGGGERKVGGIGRVEVSLKTGRKNRGVKKEEGEEIMKREET